MKKTLFLLVTLCLALVLGSGCGGGGSPSSSARAAATTAPAQAAAAAPAAVTAPPAVPAATPTTAPTAAPTTAPTAAPTTTPTKSPTQSPTQTSAPSARPATSASAAGSDVLGKMTAISAFSADFTNEGGGETAKGKIIYSNHRMRMDVEAAGIAVSMLADENKKIAYMFNPKEKSALSLPYDQSVTSQTPGEMFDWEKSVTAPPKLLGEETVDGKACAIYEFTTAQAVSKTWLDKATGFPIKSESTAEGQTVSMHFTNIVIGTVDESLLSLPPDTEITDMSGLMADLATPATTTTPAAGARATATPSRGTATAVRRTPTPGRAAPTATKAPATTLKAMAITGPVPAELKDHIKIPTGFKLVADSGQRMDNTSNHIFKATAQFTGNATPQQIADFYAGELSGDDWDYQGGVIADLNADVSYDQIDTDPVVSLEIVVERENGTSTLTLTEANGDPDASDPADALDTSYFDDFPVPDDFDSVQSTVVTSNGESVLSAEWKGQSTVKEVAAFYDTALPDAGWQDDGTAKVTAAAAILSYDTYDADLDMNGTLELVVQQSGADTDVSVTITFSLSLLCKSR